mmetsp:Transcript_213/g.713  ORF Transcript_213/g.713 Transcript_213/m.713 type:complete len:342 (-) Transcript_213:9-1034(-)
MLDKPPMPPIAHRHQDRPAQRLTMPAIQRAQQKCPACRTPQLLFAARRPACPAKGPSTMPSRSRGHRFHPLQSLHRSCSPSPWHGSQSFHEHRASPRPKLHDHEHIHDQRPATYQLLQLSSSSWPPLLESARLCSDQRCSPSRGPVLQARPRHRQVDPKSKQHATSHQHRRPWTTPWLRMRLQRLQLSLAPSCQGPPSHATSQQCQCPLNTRPRRVQPSCLHLHQPRPMQGLHVAASARLSPPAGSQSKPLNQPSQRLRPCPRAWILHPCVHKAPSWYSRLSSPRHVTILRRAQTSPATQRPRCSRHWLRLSSILHVERGSMRLQRQLPSPPSPASLFCPS